MTLVLGVDPHKQTHTAVAVRSSTAELVDELCAAARPSGYAQLLAWALAIDSDRVWALEDVRGVSRGLERFLLEHGERVVRVPPKLMADARKSARTYGKSDSIDALAIARAALAHPQLPTALQDDAARDLQLLTAHRSPLTARRWSGSEAKRKTVCAGCCTTSTLPSRSRPARWIAKSGLTASRGAWLVASKPFRSGSRETSYGAVAP